MVSQWFPRKWNQHAWGFSCLNWEVQDVRPEPPAVLDVKPAIEDVDAQIFLAFHCA